MKEYYATIYYKSGNRERFDAVNLVAAEHKAKDWLVNLDSGGKFPNGGEPQMIVVESSEPLIKDVFFETEEK